MGDRLSVLGYVHNGVVEIHRICFLACLSFVLTWSAVLIDLTRGIWFVSSKRTPNIFFPSLRRNDT